VFSRKFRLISSGRKLLLQERSFIGKTAAVVGNETKGFSLYVPALADSNGVGQMAMANMEFLCSTSGHVPLGVVPLSSIKRWGFPTNLPEIPLDEYSEER
jgi:hypothetical protein